ncbi:MAG: crossover junction endodeoxyribonuclease [Desulfobacterales bacterium C00003060]|nr:MAG: crossover junction endodeoxyribonuclease [Desulfobacterales bacterium S3730MH5]OEU77530.1 MAG: crossover junction endodeoxyribonuclease [Desulfobacterales bacterium C00003060]OEU78917.1 MAG: crossover junction endodeoxyribonuclease [Desulfobacterales bacterium S5133MH4]
MKPALKVIGIDPGLAYTGFGIVQGARSGIGNYAFGTIRTSKASTLPDRLHHIFSEVCSILNSEKPDLVTVEDIFSLKQYPKTGIVLGKVCGVILLACSRYDIVAMEIPVKELKRVLTGNGNATKNQMERTVRHLLKRDTPITPSHASDAIALALVGLFRHL